MYICMYTYTAGDSFFFIRKLATRITSAFSFRADDSLFIYIYICVYIYIYYICMYTYIHTQLETRFFLRRLATRISSAFSFRADDFFCESKVNHIYLSICICLCVFCVGPLCGPPLRWWVLCGALPSVWVPCVGPLCGSPVGVPCVGPLCVGPLCGSPVWVPRRAASCCIYSRDASRAFTRSRLVYACMHECIYSSILVYSPHSLSVYDDDDKFTPTNHLTPPPHNSSRPAAAHTDTETPLLHQKEG